MKRLLCALALLLFLCSTARAGWTFTVTNSVSAMAAQQRAEIYVIRENSATTAAAQSAAEPVVINSDGDTTTTVLLGLPLLLNCEGGVAIRYSRAHDSAPVNGMHYNLHIRLERFY